MKPRQMRLELAPSCDGAHTLLRLFGELPTYLPQADFREMIVLLSAWSGQPAELVLRADCPDGRWLDWWESAAMAVPMAQLEVRYTMEWDPTEPDQPAQ